MHHGVYALVSVFEEINLQQKKGKKKKKKTRVPFSKYFLKSILLMLLIIGPTSFVFWLT